MSEIDAKRGAVHERAEKLATEYFLRYGRIPVELKEVLAATVSDTALRKSNPYHDALGRFTFAPGYGVVSGTQKPVGRWGGQDPGAISVTLKNGETVKDAYDKLLLMPKDVSLADNVKQGEELRALPSVFTPGFFLPRYDTIFPPVKEGAMIYWFARGQPMDYQRTRSSTDKINKAYIDFGNWWCLNLKGTYYYLASYRRKPVSNTRKRNENKQQEMDSGLRRNDAYLFWLTT
ncbi:MAG: hypothetical protein WBK91_05455, partial [Alphaproteobacteria bacterium]